MQPNATMGLPAPVWGGKAVTLCLHMANEQRRRGDRRRQSRGGRRNGDRPGYTPLVLVIENETAKRDIAEAILARLRFAVVPVESADKALVLMQAIRPEIIVSPDADVPRLRASAPSDKHGRPIPIVPVPPGHREPDALIESILVALRASG
jgi:hypothetical protein